MNVIKFLAKKERVADLSPGDLFYESDEVHMVMERRPFALDGSHVMAVRVEGHGAEVVMFREDAKVIRLDHELRVWPAGQPKPEF